MTGQGGAPLSSDSGSSSWDSSESSSSESLSAASSRRDEPSREEKRSEDRQSSERSSEGTPSLSTPTTSSAASWPSHHARTSPHVPEFHAAVLNVIDLLHTALTCQDVSERDSARSAEDLSSIELPRVPSLQSLLKLKDGDVDELMGRPRRPSEGEQAAREVKRSSMPSHFKDRHGRVRHNLNSVNFETLALGMQQNDKKEETELQKSWGDIAGKLAFVLTRLDQVVPMSKARLLNEALGDAERRMSDETLQAIHGVLQSRTELGGMLQALSRSDPMKSLKEAGAVGLLVRLEEFAAYEKDISVREHQVDTPEMVHLTLQRWNVQQGFCLSNISERRQLARALCVARRGTTRRRHKRFNNSSAARKKPVEEEAVKTLVSQASMIQEEDANPKAKDILRDLTTERGVLLEIKREMTKLKRKCRVLEGQWVEQPRVLLTRLENQCRSLRVSVEGKTNQIEMARQRLSDADQRWQSHRGNAEPTLVDLEIQAYDIRRELAMSVLRYVRRDRAEALNEWRTQMAKYHQDKVRMRGNFAEAVRSWRQDANFAAPGPAGVNPWKASLAFTPDAVLEGDPEDDDKLATRRVQVDQGLTLAGITRNQLINQERLLDNYKRPLGNSWELLRRQYITYNTFLEGQLQHWLRGDFLGPLLRRVRDLTGQLNSSLVEIVGELEAVRSGAREDIKVPDFEAKRREGDRRQRTGKDRSEIKMEEALTAILLHVEKEMALLASITAPKGELTELLRSQQDLSALAAARPFKFTDIAGDAPPPAQPSGRKHSKSAAAGDAEPPPVTYFRLQEGLEAPNRAARQLARVMNINWSTYIAKWELLIRRYLEARSAYMEFQQKCAETARQKMVRDLRERPYLFEDLLQKSQAKWRQVENEFHKDHVQPVVDRFRELSNGVADLSTELLLLKKDTHAMQQDTSLSFATALMEENNEDLLGKYRQELEAETHRSQELDRQIAAQKEMQRVLSQQQMRPKLSSVAQAARLMQDLGGDTAKAARKSLNVEQVLGADELTEVIGLADRAMRERGYKAGLQPRKLLQLLETLLWPNGTWKDPDAEARKREKKTRRVSIASVASSAPSNARDRSPWPKPDLPEAPTGEWANQAKAISVVAPPAFSEDDYHLDLDDSLGVRHLRRASTPDLDASASSAASDVPERDLTVDLVMSVSVAPPSEPAGPAKQPAAVVEAGSRPPLPPARSPSPPSPHAVPAQGSLPPSPSLQTPPPPALPESEEAMAPKDAVLETEAANAEDATAEGPPPVEVGRAEERSEEVAGSDTAFSEDLTSKDNVLAAEDSTPPVPADADVPLSEDPGLSAFTASEPTLEAPDQAEAKQEDEDGPVPQVPSTEEPDVATVPNMEMDSHMQQEPDADVLTAAVEDGTAEIEDVGDASPLALPAADSADATVDAEVQQDKEDVPATDTSSSPRKVRIAEDIAETAEPVVQEEERVTFVEPDPEVGQEEDPKALISQLFQVFSHSDASPSNLAKQDGPPRPRWKDWIKGPEAAQSHPVLKRMQEVREALLGSDPVPRPSRARVSLRGWVRQRSRLADAAAPESPKGGLSVGDLKPNVFKVLDRRPTRRSPPWMTPDKVQSGFPTSFFMPKVQLQDSKPLRLLISSDSNARMGRLGTPTQITLDLADAYHRQPSPPLGPCRMLGAGFKAPMQSRPDSRRESTRPSTGDLPETPPLAASRAGTPGPLTDFGQAKLGRPIRESERRRPQSAPGLEAQLWGNAHRKGQWRVLLGAGPGEGANKAGRIQTTELNNLVSARGLQAKSHDVAAVSPTRPTASSPERKVAIATQDLSQLLQFVQWSPGGPSKQRSPQAKRRRPLTNAKVARPKAAPARPAVPKAPAARLEPTIELLRPAELLPARQCSGSD